jgi:hypothetical protein
MPDIREIANLFFWVCGFYNLDTFHKGNLGFSNAYMTSLQNCNIFQWFNLGAPDNEWTNRLNRMNQWVANVAVCLDHYYQELIGCHNACSRDLPWLKNGSGGEWQCLAMMLNRKPSKLLLDWCQFNASRSISPSDRCFTVSSRSVGLLF